MSYNDDNIQFCIYAKNRDDFEAQKNEHTTIGLIATGEVWINGTYYPFGVTANALTNLQNALELRFNIQSQLNDATIYTIYQGGLNTEARLDILVPKVTATAGSFITVTPKKSSIDLDNSETEEVDSSFELTPKVQSIANATDTDDGLVSALDVKTTLEDYVKRGEGNSDVVEVTAEEFTFRPTAGSTSINGSDALIRKIKGNTTIWQQRISLRWSAYDATSISLGRIGDTAYKASLLKDFTDNTARYRLGVRVGSPILITGHKYLICGYIRASIASSSSNFGLETRGQTYTMYPAVTEVNKWTLVSRTFTLADLNNNHAVYLQPSWDYVQRGLSGSWFEARDLMLIDLTALYGEGNEPYAASGNTAAQVEALAKFKELYPNLYYNELAPQLRGMCATGIETIGANAFDKNSAVGGVIDNNGFVTSNDVYSVANIEVVGNQVYSLTNVANSALVANTYAFYNSRNELISVGGIKDSISLSTEVSGDVTIPMNTSYMRVVVHNDSLDRCCVNLKHTGTLDIENATYFKSVRELPEIATYFPNGMHGIGDVYDEINEEYAIQRCGKRTYIQGDENDAEVRTDYYNTIYKLSQPVYTPIVEPLQLDYKVSDFGTERALAPEKSSPFKADIAYQFNEVDRIRDNARNIERLEKGKQDVLISGQSIKTVGGMDVLGEGDIPFPTAVATATQRAGLTSTTTRISPNVIYEAQQSFSTYVLPTLSGDMEGYDNVWTLRFGIGSSDNLTIPYSVLWVNGQAPSFTSWCIVEIKLRKQSVTNQILGEWKIYK